MHLSTPIKMCIDFTNKQYTIYIYLLYIYNIYLPLKRNIRHMEFTVIILFLQVSVANVDSAK